MNWLEDWNGEVGLWSSKGPGHTESTKNIAIVHSGPSAANRLLGAAQTNALKEIEVEQILSTLLEMQWIEEDELRGCLRWYWEEDCPIDTNAAFFTGLSLIVLRKQFYKQLDQQCRNLLDKILLGLDVWFDTAVGHAAYYYPNRYLGDLVCQWMLMEVNGKVNENSFVSEHMQNAAKYWLENGWGWGEHLSDGYASVCLTQLSILLMLTDELPEDLRTMYMKLMGELLAIEDSFDGGPRVPALRSYAFEKPPPHINYRNKIKPWKKIPDICGNMPDLSDLMYNLGWHEVMPVCQLRQSDLKIPCFDGAIATACIKKDIRLGSVSRFPVMPSAEYPTWGLSWQCFPVAFSHGESDWGFLQWESVEKGTRRAHPANGGPKAHIPKALSENVMPPICGKTYALQRGTSVLVLRIMRLIPKSWTSVTDRFRVVELSAEVSEIHNDSCSQLLLKYPECELSLYHVALMKGEKPELSYNNAGDMDWSVTCDAPKLHEKRVIMHLWAISLDGSIDTVPVIKTIAETSKPRLEEEKVRKIRWEWRDTLWDIVIDPLNKEPLVEI